MNPLPLSRKLGWVGGKKAWPETSNLRAWQETSNLRGLCSTSDRHGYFTWGKPRRATQIQPAVRVCAWPPSGQIQEKEEVVHPKDVTMRRG